MSKRGIIGRVTQLAHANVRAIIDSADNPQQAADELARDYASTIAEAEQAITELAENRRVTADDQREDAEAAEMWAATAAATSQTADELRAAGDAAAADRFDDLARVALARELTAANDVETSQQVIAAQTESVETLRNGLGSMQVKLSELADNRHSLSAGSLGAQARQGRRDGAIRNVDIMDPASEVALFDDVVRQEESRLHSVEAKARPAEAQAAEFAYTGGNSAYETEIEERLQGLKAARAMASALARAHDQNG